MPEKYICPSGDILPLHDPQYQTYTWMMILRKCIIFFSATALLINIIIILKKKQYKFNTIKLFMFVQIFYVISLLSVTPHNIDFNLKAYNMKTQDAQDNFQPFMECLISRGEEFACAMEGFVNLTCYGISYWFAICITIYIKHVLENNHKQFMKKRGPIIFSIIAFIIIWYFIPFIFTLIQGMPFSFGPTGYRLMSQSGKDYDYFLYSGIVPRQQFGKGLVIFWMLFLPITLFFYHSYILFTNRKMIKQLVKQDQINPRQFFIIKSGNLSLVIFIVQLSNVFKLMLVLLAPPENNLGYEIFIIVINSLFDFLGLLLIVIYCKYYYKQGRNLQQNSQVMNRSLAYSFTSTGSFI